MSSYGEKLQANRQRDVQTNGKTDKRTNGQIDGGYFKGNSLRGSKKIHIIPKS